MPDTKQTRAILAANTLMMTLAPQAEALYNAFQKFLAEYNAEQYATTWNALPTCAQNADGSLGTADGTPTAGHPINTAIVSGLAKAVPATQLTSMVTCCQQAISFFTNVAVIQGNYIQSVADLAD